MLSILQANRVPLQEDHVKFVNKTGGLDGVTGQLTPEERIREFTEARVSDRDDFVEGGALALPPSIQKSGNVARRLHSPCSRTLAYYDIWLTKHAGTVRLRSSMTSNEFRILEP